MENLEKMINDIDVESLEKTINMLSGLKTFKKYNCETCRHEILSICLDCDIKNKSKGWEQKQSEKSIEGQIFELIKDNFLFSNTGNRLDAFRELVEQIYLNDYKIATFKIILKGVHELIEGNNFRFHLFRKKWHINYSEDKYFFHGTDFIFNLEKFPSSFYFSSDKNREKARNILSDFFGINILNWWCKGCKG